jgi:transposase
MGSLNSHQLTRKGKSWALLLPALISPRTFLLGGVNESGAVQLRQPKVARGRLNALIAAYPPCVIGMEACSGAHHWARQFQAHGHTVKLMAPKLVGAPMLAE